MSLGVGLVVDLHQVVNTDMGVFLGGRERGVTEEFLDGAQISAPFQHMGSEGMSEGMW